MIQNRRAKWRKSERLKEDQRKRDGSDHNGDDKVSINLTHVKVLRFSNFISTANLINSMMKTAEIHVRQTSQVMEIWKMKTAEAQVCLRRVREWIQKPIVRFLTIWVTSRVQEVTMELLRQDQGKRLNLIHFYLKIVLILWN